MLIFLWVISPIYTLSNVKSVNYETLFKNHVTLIEIHSPTFIVLLKMKILKFTKIKTA